MGKADQCDSFVVVRLNSMGLGLACLGEEGQRLLILHGVTGEYALTDELVVEVGQV